MIPLSTTGLIIVAAIVAVISTVTVLGAIFMARRDRQEYEEFLRQKIAYRTQCSYQHAYDKYLKEARAGDIEVNAILEQYVDKLKIESNNYDEKLL